MIPVAGPDVAAGPVQVDTPPVRATSLLRRSLRLWRTRIGVILVGFLVLVSIVGPYLAGMASVGGYMAALAVAIPLIDPTHPLISDRSDVIVFAAVTAFFGLIFGHWAFRKRAAA